MIKKKDILVVGNVSKYHTPCQIKSKNQLVILGFNFYGSSTHCHFIAVKLCVFILFYVQKVFFLAFLRLF
jgi:hypothetical protein